MKQRTFNKTTTARIFQEFCNTLEYIHGKGFLHKDLKSNNVFLELKQDGYLPIINVFGMSGSVEEMEGHKQIHEAKYIVPEVRKGQKQSLASDIF